MTTKLRLLRTENAVTVPIRIAVIPMPNIASIRVKPLARWRGPDLVNVVLKSIAANVGGEFTAAVETARLPIELDGDLFHVVAVGRADGRVGNGQSPRIDQPGRIRGIGVVVGRKGR